MTAEELYKLQNVPRRYHLRTFIQSMSDSAKGTRDMRLASDFVVHHSPSTLYTVY